MEKICLDFETAVDFLRGEPSTIEKLKYYADREELCITSHTMMHLLETIKKRDVVVAFANSVTILPFDKKAAHIATGARPCEWSARFRFQPLAPAPPAAQRRWFPAHPRGALPTILETRGAPNTRIEAARVWSRSAQSRSAASRVRTRRQTELPGVSQMPPSRPR